jgi:putative ABC transport system permease protein
MRVAWTQALASIRVRFLRQIVTTIGISLGIAFFSSVELNRITTKAVSSDDSDRLKWLIATSLVMCLVGVTNSMLMSVAERYREIGTIKCLGASDRFIVTVFFFEAAILGATGSIAGSITGSLLMDFSQFIQHIPVSFSDILYVVALGTGIGIFMTVAAAIAPAYQAAKMPAAAALRVEV